MKLVDSKKSIQWVKIAVVVMAVLVVFGFCMNTFRLQNRPSDQEIANKFMKHKGSFEKLVSMAQIDIVDIGENRIGGFHKEFTLLGKPKWRKFTSEDWILSYNNLKKERYYEYLKLLKECDVIFVEPEASGDVNFYLHLDGFLDTGTYTRLAYRKHGQPVGFKKVEDTKKAALKSNKNHDSFYRYLEPNWFITYVIFR